MGAGTTGWGIKKDLKIEPFQEPKSLDIYTNHTISRLLEVAF
jgi:hypothetical protein